MELSLKLKPVMQFSASKSALVSYGPRRVGTAENDFWETDNEAWGSVTLSFEISV